MKYKFCVITRIRDLHDILGDAILAISSEHELIVDPPEGIPARPWMFVKVPAFRLGELLVLEDPGEVTEYSREIGCGRKPSKWGVVYELFDDLPSAAARINQVLKLVEPPPETDGPSD